MTSLHLWGELRDAGAIPEMYDGPPAGGGGAAFPAIRPTRNANPSVSLPQTGYINGWNTPAAPSWSAWQQITAGEASPYILDKLHLNVMAYTGLSWWVQLGIGAADNEVDFATFGGSLMAAGTDPYIVFPVHFNLDGYRLPAGTRLSIRSRHTSAAANDSRFSAVVIAMPDPPLFSPDWDEETYRAGGVAAITRYPAVPNYTAVLSGTANNWGNWVEFIASAPSHLLVYTLEDYVGALLQYCHRFQIGIGASGQEVAHELTATPTRATAGAYTIGAWPLPRQVEVLQGERVCVRHNNSIATRTAQVALGAYTLT
jgi:hypothetical protein